MTMVGQQFQSLPSQEHFDPYMGRIDQRFEQIGKQFDVNTGRLTNLELLKSQVNLHTWMLGLIIIVLVVLQLQRWFAVV